MGKYKILLPPPLSSLSVPLPSPHHQHTHKQAQNANETGDHDSARRLGRFSLGWNIGVYIFYVLATIAWIIGVAVWATSFTRSIISGSCYFTSSGAYICG